MNQPDRELTPAGVAVTALFREMLVATGKFTYAEAESLSQQFDQNIVDADWLSTLNGTTFNRSFDPTEYKKRYLTPA
jgi:hypothetical protein